MLFIILGVAFWIAAIVNFDNNAAYWPLIIASTVFFIIGLVSKGVRW